MPMVIRSLAPAKTTLSSRVIAPLGVKPVFTV
jgi:hypothetical protein